MSLEPETEAAITARLAAVKKTIAKSGVARSAGSRKKAEIKQRLSGGDRRMLRSTGRTALFQVRAKPDLYDACKAAAAARDMKLAAWVEEHLEAALASEGIKL